MDNKIVIGTKVSILKCKENPAVEGRVGIVVYKEDTEAARFFGKAIKVVLLDDRTVNFASEYDLLPISRKEFDSLAIVEGLTQEEIRDWLKATYATLPESTVSGKKKGT